MRIMIITLLVLALTGCDSKEVTTGEPATAEAEEVAAEVTGSESEPEPETQPQTQGQEFPEDMKDGESAHFGQPFSIDGEPVGLATAVDAFEDGAGPVKVKAKIAAVCQTKGCWFTLADTGLDRPVRVRMKDYAFIVPKNTADADAIIEGQITRRELTQEEIDHYMEDAKKHGVVADNAEAAKYEYEFTATGIEIIKG